MLSLKKIAISEAGKQKIATCTEIVQLDEWLGRILDASSEAELFQGKKTRKPTTKKR